MYESRHCLLYLGFLQRVCNRLYNECQCSSRAIHLSACITSYNHKILPNVLDLSLYIFIALALTVSSKVSADSILPRSKTLSLYSLISFSYLPSLSFTTSQVLYTPKPVCTELSTKSRTSKALSYLSNSTFMSL